MKTIAEAVAFNIKASKEMLDALAADLKGSDWEHRATTDSNCAAWLVGHLVLTDRNALKTIGVTDLQDLPEGFDKMYGRGDGAPAAAHFGDPNVLLPLFNKHRDMIIAAVLKMPETKFAEPLPKPNPRFKDFGEFLIFMGVHVSVHCGQISTIRRSLGRPPLR